MGKGLEGHKSHDTPLASLPAFQRTRACDGPCLLNSPLLRRCRVWDVAIWDGHEHVTVPRMPPELRGEVVAGAAAQEVAASSPQRIPSQGRSTPTLLPPLETEMTELQAIDRDGQQSPNEPDGVAQVGPPPARPPARPPASPQQQLPVAISTSGC